MEIVYPIGCETSGQKTEFLYTAQEKLRLVHNVFSEWLHKGLAKDRYDLLPEKIKAKYPYESRLSKGMWNKFKEEDFDLRSNTICQEICVQRAELKKSTRWSIDIGEI